MAIFGVKFWARNLQNTLHHINSAKNLSKFCLYKFSSKLNPIWEKRVLKFKFISFCPVNLNQHCTHQQKKKFKNVLLKVWENMMRMQMLEKTDTVRKNKALINSSFPILVISKSKHWKLMVLLLMFCAVGSTFFHSF